MGTINSKEIRQMAADAKAHALSRHEQDMTFDVSLKTARRLISFHDHIAGKRFLDIGGCTGVVAETAARFLGCQVRSYEPFPLSLEKWIGGDDVELVPRAVTADGRTVEIAAMDRRVDQGYLCSASILGKRSTKRGQRNLFSVGSDPFPAILDDFKPEALKIDIEGAEYELLESIEMLPRGLSFLFVEFHGIPRQAKRFAGALLAIMESGLHPIAGFPYNMRLEGETLKKVGFWSEIVFVRKEGKPLTETKICRNILFGEGS